MAQPLARPEPSELTLRILSAAVILPLAVAAIWLGHWYFTAFIALTGIAMSWEWSGLCRAPVGLRLLFVVTVLLAIVLSFGGLYREAFGCIAGGALILAVTARIGRAEAPVLLPVGAVYVSLALLALFWVRFSTLAGLVVFLWMIAVVVATDVGAYFAGRAIGGPKLAPRISPAKTWSGLAGGVVCAAGAGAVTMAVTGGNGYLGVACLSGALAVVAQAGDLIESAVKRRFGAKDAGHLIPGHGGVLDRIDGFLTVAPATALMTWIAGRSPLEWQ
jgi:phosphatidate cytidylyltransferase